MTHPAAPWLVLAALAPGAAADEPVASDAQVVEETDASSFDAWAFAAEGYRLRTAQDGSTADHDARLLVDAGARAFDEAIGVDLSGALFWDIDGASPGLSSVHDARGPLDFFVDTLELRAAGDSWFIERASFGRFTVVQGWATTLDGAALSIAPARNDAFTWIVFSSVGRTVHFFDTSEDIEGTGDRAFEDWAASVGTDVILPEGLKLQVDYRALVQDSAAQRARQSYGAAFFRRVDDVMLLQLYGRGLDEQLSHVGGRLHLAWTPRSPGTPRAPGSPGTPRAPWRVGLDVDAVEQTATLGELLFEDQNPFFAILGESAPHVRGSADAYGRVDVGGAFDGGLHLGAAGRRLMRRSDAGPFNRDAARVYAAVDAADIAKDALVPGLFASLVLSYDFAVDAAEDSVAALGGTVGWAGDVVRCSVGTAWDRTKYTYYRDVDELTDVRTIFASAEWRPLRALRVRADYRAELADRLVHVAQVTVAHEIDVSTRDSGGTW